jgi:hypothetical protein
LRKRKRFSPRSRSGFRYAVRRTRGRDANVSIEPLARPPRNAADPEVHSPITPQMMRSPAFPAGSLA